MNKELLDKYQGCLVGGTVGDGLGYVVEFLTYNQIINKYGDNGITEYDTWDHEKALISDDTQMTYFTGKGLLDTMEPKSYQDFLKPIYENYKYWAVRQDRNFEGEMGDMNPELFNRRAPGHTCLSALYGKHMGTLKKIINRSKGSGGVMRVAPIALISKEKFPIEDIVRLGCESAAITHTHPLGFLPAAMETYIIRSILDGNDLLDAILESKDVMKEIYGTYFDLPLLFDLVDKAIKLSFAPIEDIEAINAIGEGWVAEEGLAIAIYCALRHQDSFEEAIIASVNHDGDSDTTGEITGNIIGAYLGMSAIPDKFLKNLELKEDMETLAKDILLDPYLN